MAERERTLVERRDREPTTEREIVPAFVIEADHPRNGNLLLQAIPGLVLRGALSATKPSTNFKSGAKVVSPDQSSFLGQFPDVPGMHLHVDPAKLSYKVIDPLDGDEELCAKLTAAMRRKNAMSGTRQVRGVKPQSGKLDAHRIKTLVRECIQLVQAGEARVVKGVLPKMEDVEQLPGNFLLNPGSRIRNTQPQFEKDWDAWYERLNAAGG